MDGCDVALPLNLDDDDIDASMVEGQMPRERVSVTGMSFVLMMMEIVRLVGGLAGLLRGNGSGIGCGISGNTQLGTEMPTIRSKCLKEQSRRLVEETRMRMDTKTLRHCDVSRPFDWFLLVITKVLLVSPFLSISVYFVHHFVFHSWPPPLFLCLCLPFRKRT